MKVYELEFYVRDSAGQTRPYDATACLIMVYNGMDSVTALETKLMNLTMPENVMLKVFHRKNVNVAEGCPFTVSEALHIKGYRYPDHYAEGTADIFYKDRDKMATERLKGRTYLISAPEDLTEVERQIWKHFDIGLRFTLTEEALHDTKVRARMYGYGPIGGY
ncbi:molybdenum ABC transporter [Yersinia phage vB_YenM_P8]